jgi:SAM-dependent methyltransferase
MSLQTLAEWLRCPICCADLSAAEPLALHCVNGHAFDVNKRGFVSLLGGTSRKLVADSPAMLDARDRFLSAGWFSPLREALCAAIGREQPRRVLDVGCGTGYYLQAVVAETGARALAMDLSPAAVTRAVRRFAPVGGARPGSRDGLVDGLVADVWSPLPVRTGTADVILNVFAPRNAAEFHRVLRPAGLLAVVIPRSSHLQELRESGQVIDVQAGKAAQLVDSLHSRFSVESSQEITLNPALSPRDVASLVGMGPSAHHTDAAGLAQQIGETNEGGGAPLQQVTAAFELLSFRRRELRGR